MKNRLIVLAILSGSAVVLIATWWVFRSPAVPEFSPDRELVVNTVAEPPAEALPVLDLTLESTFGSNHNLDDLPPENLRTLIFTGDVLLARSVNYQIWQHNNPSYPFEKVADVLRAADLTFINLENPLVENCPLTNEGMIFCGDPRNVRGLVDAGIDVVGLANNHTLNYGQAGLGETVSILKKNGLRPVCSGEFATQDIRGLRFAFLAYNDVPAKVDAERMGERIREAKETAAVVIVYFHWGSEYTAYPNQRQEALAHLVVEAGADLVVGSHPHWIQAVEIYQGVPILYSLGNFVFDQEWSQKTKEGAAARCTFYHNQLIDIELLPVLIENYSQPRWLVGEEGRQILEELEQISRKLTL
ncbi:MAG: CapA family protein [Syntrophaceae bacterium]|nr:CapA family protein [Syntrophaceae bacterium]